MATSHIYLSILTTNFIKISSAIDILYGEGDRHPRTCFSSFSTMSQTYDIINIAVTSRVLSILHFVSQLRVNVSWSLHYLTIMRIYQETKKLEQKFWSPLVFEPHHNKTNKMSSENSDQPGHLPVWSESSLSAWRKLGSLATHWADSEDYDQSRRMPRLIWVFAGAPGHFVGFVMMQFISDFNNSYDKWVHIAMIQSFRTDRIWQTV